jgi:hypothetical protein
VGCGAAAGAGAALLALGAIACFRPTAVRALTGAPTIPAVAGERPGQPYLRSRQPALAGPAAPPSRPPAHSPSQPAWRPPQPPRPLPFAPPASPSTPPHAPPPPARPPPHPSAASRLRRINARYANGHPSNDLHVAGVMVTMILSSARPWVAHTPGRLSCTVVNARLTGTYAHPAGMVLAAGPTQACLWCAFPYDAGTNGPAPCSKGNEYPPSRFAEMMRHRQGGASGVKRVCARHARAPRTRRVRSLSRPLSALTAMWARGGFAAQVQ